MKTRIVTLPSGQTFTVPQNIQRIDSRSTHGWQVRYGGTKFFSDGSPDGTGADKSLQLATRELMRRIATLPAPVRVKERVNLSNKGSELPPGISGPIVKSREGEQFLRRYEDSSGTKGVLHSRGWQGDTWVWEGTVTEGNGTRTELRETITRLGERQFHARYELKSGEDWVFASEETLTRR